jgi:hypothetical protein
MVCQLLLRSLALVDVQDDTLVVCNLSIFVPGCPSPIVQPALFSRRRENTIFETDTPFTPLTVALGKSDRYSIQVIGVDDVRIRNSPGVEVFWAISELPYVFGHKFYRPSFLGTPKKRHYRTAVNNTLQFFTLVR